MEIKKLSIVIPVYNERNTILKIFSKIKEIDLGNTGKEIIIIDDYSTDGTREILRGLGNEHKIIYHDRNQGKGAAIRTGLKHVTGDWVIIQDADLEYDPNDYIKLLECARENNALVVYGARRAKANLEGGIYSSIYFAIGGILVTWLTNFLYKTNLTDESTCYKMFQTDLLRSIPLRCKRFEFCPEVTAKIAKRGIKIYEIPINYYPRHKKEGKKISWKDGLEAIWTLIKYKFVD